MLKIFTPFISPLVSVAAASCLVLTTLPAAFAQSVDVYDPHANFGQPSEVSASFYVRVPFNGGLKRSANEEARFGFAVRTRLPQQFSYAPMSQGYAFQGTYSPQIKVLDLSLGPSVFKSGGFKSFKLNGHSLNEWNALYADEEGEDDGGMSTGTKIALGVGAAAVAIILVSVIVVCTDNDQDPFNSC